MRRGRANCLVASTVVLVAAWAASAAAEVALKTQAWQDNDAAFETFAQQIRGLHPRNLLARRTVRVIAESGASEGGLQALFDGEAGQRGSEGRVMIGGQPSVIDFYLGEPKTITEIGAMTFNSDTRTNQDYEVRFCDNSANPGVKPEFPERADLTTGEKILGPDHGGFQTRFAQSGGGPLLPGKADWVQFRIWRTYDNQAGEPAKSLMPGSSSAYIELQVLGEEADVVVPTPAELALRKAFQQAPKAPTFVEKPTWPQTMIANREAIFAWEEMQDTLAASRSNALLGPWYVLGPMPSKSEDVTALRKATEIDLAQRLPGRDGQEIGWEKREDLTDGQIHDLTGDRDGDKKEIYFLCRSVVFVVPPGKNEYAIEVNADQGSATWLPSRKKHGVGNSLELSRGGTDLGELSGKCQFLLELRTDGQRQNRFRFVPQPASARPGAGAVATRLNRRQQLESQIRQLFTSAVDQSQIRWEAADEIWNDRQARNVQDWFPGHVDAYLKPKYSTAIAGRIEKLQTQLEATEGIEALVVATLKDRLAAWIETFQNSLAGELDVAQLRGKYYRIAAVQDTVAAACKVRSMRLAVEDQRKTFGDRYPAAAAYLGRIDTLAQQVDAAWDRVLQSDDALAAMIELHQGIDEAGREILLANPVLGFDKLLAVKGNSSFNSNWGGPNSLGSEMVVLSPVRPDGKLTTIYSGPIADMDLNWDGRRILFSDRKLLWEINADGTGLRQVTPTDDLTRYDACYLPNGQIVCSSNACQQAVPCTGGPNVGNLHLINADGSGERRLTFDQDHDWNPVVMHDGRVLYTRWEYTDAPHYFSRLLFRMNPDGSGQMEYYGSNSYWPNATYWPRPIPGHPTMISCVISGHHGVSRTGEMLLLDPAKGRHEADGAVQKIPGYGKKVEAITMDQLVIDSWPKFAAPYPLAETETNLGAGKYFLACVKRDDASNWDLCLVDIYDNITPILTGGYMTPIPLQPRPTPPIIPSQVDPTRKEATVYLANVYEGPGVKGFPRGSIKQLRVGTHHYRYFGNGDTRASSLEGGWDIKRILGTVPVNEDGSAMFQVPANTPIFIQPVDAEGKAQQVMRSWFTAMPGEFLSCVGCHEKQNVVPPSRYSTAAIGQRPAVIEPWYGPARGFGFEREVQPMLDRRCVGCHNDKPYTDGQRTVATLDLRAKRLHGERAAIDPKAPANKFSETDYSPAYLALQQYVRRPGYESDYHMPKPAEYEADTSMLVQMLKKGHYNVELTDEEWQHLYAWIDYNVPYPINWRESHRPPTDDQVELRAKYKKLYANIDDRDEDPVSLPPIEKFQPPKPMPGRPSPLKLAGWPLTTEQAQKLQSDAGPVERELDLGDGVTMKFVLVPAGRFVLGEVDGFADESEQAAVTIPRPFYLGRFEVTNRQFNRFDADHNNGVINERWKDRTRRGTPIDAPELPVVRITWRQAMDFCQWLSQRTGQSCTLPSEAQWEWACRAGTDTPYAIGRYTPQTRAFANIADETAKSWNHGRAQTGYSDGVSFTAEGGRFAPNAWGLCDMHGNVAEWCRTTYRPYPYRAEDGRDDPNGPGMKVVRGGSWNDLLPYVSSASRWRYEPYKPVYNVGFRVMIELDGPQVVATATGQ